jgi:DNA-binding CsgD family transcriptional regulator
LTDSEPSQENVRHLPAKTGEFRPRPRDIGRQTRAGILTRAQRRNRVLELRAAGLTEQQIADQLGMTQGADAPVRVERHTTVELEVDSREIQRMEDAWLHSGGSVIDAVVADDEQS